MLDRICLRFAFLSSADTFPLNVLPYSGLAAASARCAASRSCPLATHSVSYMPVGGVTDTV